MLIHLDQGCPTRGPLGKLVRPFLLLSSLTPLLRVGKFFREVNFVEMSEKFRGGGVWGIGFWQV